MSAPDSTPQSAPDIQREIEQTRERLGQTVEELAGEEEIFARAASVRPSPCPDGSCEPSVEDAHTVHKAGSPVSK